MEIVRADEHPVQVGADTYTGQVWNEVLATGVAPWRLHVARVTFAPGARSAWHHHPVGQVLVVLSGLGRTQLVGGRIEVLRPGDTVSVGAGEEHWHGADPDHVLVHLAIQEASETGEQAIWGRPVSEQEYRDHRRSSR